MPFMDTEAGSPSTPASNPEMFPTFSFGDGFQKPSSAAMGLGEGFMKDMTDAFPFFSGLTTPTPKAKEKADGTVPQGDLTGEEAGNPFAANSPTGKVKPDPSIYDAGTPGSEDKPFKLAANTTTLMGMFRGEAKSTAKANVPLGDVTASLPVASSDMAKVAWTAAANDINPKALQKIAHIESGNNPNAQTGSYKGLFQLSEREFQKYNPGGNIFNATDNTVAATRKIAAEATQFQAKYGREPTVLDTYMIHQQGDGGYANHMKNPDAPAWQNMLATGEGRQKGETWAKAAIWGNIPTKYKANFSSVNDVTSRDFVNIWANRLGSEALQPVIKKDAEKAPALKDAGTPASSMQLAGGLLDTVLKPFGYRTKTEAETNLELKYNDIQKEMGNANIDAAEYEKRFPGLGGLKALRNYQLQKQNDQLNNVADTRET